MGIQLAIDTANNEGHCKTLSEPLLTLLNFCLITRISWLLVFVVLQEVRKTELLHGIYL